MTPERSQQLAMPVVEVYMAIEEQILINIAKQLRESKKLMEDDIQAWQLKKLMELGTLTQQNIITIAKHAGMAVNEVSKMLEEAGYSAVDEIEGDLAEAVQMGVAVQPPAIAESTALAAILTAYQQQAINTFNLVNTTMLQQAEQAYIDILNQTVGKVLTGVQTPQQALRETAARWAEQGIPALIDKKGRKWTTEAYVNMVMRSMSNRISNDMQFARMDDYGVDLIEVSSHLDARPKCAPYQGRIYSRSGRHPKYPPFNSTSYGQPDGLLGINCRHVIYPYIEGVSKQRFHPYDLDQVSKAYKQSQKQRYLERQIRYAKRELAMMEAMDDKEGIEKAKEKVKQRQAKMREFIKETGRTRQYHREQITPLDEKTKEHLRNYNNGLGNGNRNVRIPNSTLKHAAVGDFTNPKNPKKQKIGNMKSGGHGQSNIQLLEEHGIEYNIVEVLPNGVRLGNVPNHKNKLKRTGKNQVWFPKNWTDEEIEKAGLYVANLQDKNKYILEETPVIIRKFANYKGVTVGVVYDKHQRKITTIFPDSEQRLLGGDIRD
ncbi:MAG: hypothetical protein C6P36_02785 [Geobacillus sp.]|nr:MAG: hypothetical protein C6P36_02785 [Geobacillus sp.]